MLHAATRLFILTQSTQRVKVNHKHFCNSKQASDRNAGWTNGFRKHHLNWGEIIWDIFIYILYQGELYIYFCKCLSVYLPSHLSVRLSVWLSDWFSHWLTRKGHDKYIILEMWCLYFALTYLDLFCLRLSHRKNYCASETDIVFLPAWCAEKLTFVQRWNTTKSPFQ